MSNVSRPAAAPAPLRSLADVPADPSVGIAAAAHVVLSHLERGSCIDAVALRRAMEHAFGGSDAAGAWDWKTAYDACEAATVLFMRKFGPAIRVRPGSPAAELSMLGRIAAVLLRVARPIWCSNPPRARVCLPSSPSSPAAGCT
jgi:hypothetical protein